MTTTTKTQTVQDILKLANPNLVADVLRMLGLGFLFAPIKVVVTAITASATFDITTAAFGADAAVTITGVDALGAGEGLPALGALRTLRVTASATAASLGTYILSDAGGTALIPPGGADLAVGIALISDDGKTITFPNTVTGFVLGYQARPAVAMTDLFADFI